MKLSLSALLLLGPLAVAADPLERGEPIPLDRVVPANERGILCLAVGKDGVYAGTTGRAAHLLKFDPATGAVRSDWRLAGGIGFAHAFAVLPDGSLFAGTQADPTGIAVRTDPTAVGQLYHVRPDKADEAGVPVPGQGIYTLAYEPTTNTVVGLTWPDGHLFTHDIKAGTSKDHRPVTGYRTFETPRHAEDLNRGSGESVRYARQVSKAIIVHKGAAYTGGADGVLFRFDCASGKLEKLTLRLPAVRGRESWASIDAAVSVGDSVIGGTSDGYLFELRLGGAKPAIRSLGKPLAQGNIQGLVEVNGVVHGIGGE